MYILFLYTHIGYRPGCRVVYYYYYYYLELLLLVRRSRRVRLAHFRLRRRSRRHVLLLLYILYSIVNDNPINLSHLQHLSSEQGRRTSQCVTAYVYIRF